MIDTQTSVTPDMIEWAKKRRDETAEASRIAGNAHRTAERDLAGIIKDKPTMACINRFKLSSFQTLNIDKERNAK